MDFDIYLKRIEKEIDSILPPEADKIWALKSFGENFSDDFSKNFSPLIAPTRSLVDLGGKRWRPLLLVLCAGASAFKLEKDSEQIKENAFHLTPMVELIHTASLIHDDIEDKSDSRRGKPSAYITYGLDTALNAASWLYFQAAVPISTLNVTTEMKNRLYSLYAAQIRRLHLGQAMDIKWHNDKNSRPSQTDYLTMVSHKTGTLSSLAAAAGTMVSGADDKTVEKIELAAQKIGQGFQIIDDVINLTTGNPGKNRGDDIVEGKKSLPVLIFFEENEKSASELVGYFNQAAKEGISSEAVEKSISLLDKSGAIQKAKKQGKSLITEGAEDFQNIFGQENPFAQNIKDLFFNMIPKNYLKGEDNA